MVAKFFALTDKQLRTHLLTKASQIDLPGRNTLTLWINVEWKGWGIWAAFDEALALHGKDMFSVARESLVQNLFTYVF